MDWSDVAGASGYNLQEDDHPGFTSPLGRYLGSNTHFQVSGQANGTWYYRVQASNDGGESLWSETRSVYVGPVVLVYAPLVVRDYFFEPDEPNDTFEQAWGPLASGQTYHAYFPSESDNNDYYYLDLSAPHSLEIWLTNIPAGNDYALYVYDAAHALVPGGYSDNYDDADEHIALSSMPAGRYYVRVERVTGISHTQPYALRAVFR